MLRLIYIDDFNKVPIDKDFYNTLSNDRKSRYDLYLNLSDRKRFLVSEQAILNGLLDFFCISNPNVKSNEHKKPFVEKNNQIDFNKSYCDSSICIAINDSGQIGIDCERIQIKNESIMRYFFTPNEIQYVESSAYKDFAFTLIWTRKESFIKCINRGLDFNIKELDTAPMQKIQKNEKLFFDNDCIKGFYINSYFINGLLISVCSSNDDKFPDFQGGM